MKEMQHMTPLTTNNLDPFLIIGITRMYRPNRLYRPYGLYRPCVYRLYRRCIENLTQKTCDTLVYGLPGHKFIVNSHSYR